MSRRRFDFLLLMKMSASNVARGAVATALTVVLLYFAALIPSGRLALLCASSLGIAFLRMRCGVKTALLGFVASSVLAFLLVSEKGVVFAYFLFAGYYPLVKLETERISQKFIRWGVRLGVFNLALILLLVLAKVLFSVWIGAVGGSYIVFILLANAAFVAYDYALTQLILIYLRKYDGRI